MSRNSGSTFAVISFIIFYCLAVAACMSAAPDRYQVDEPSGSLSQHFSNTVQRFSLQATPTLTPSLNAVGKMVLDSAPPPFRERELSKGQHTK